MNELLWFVNRAAGLVAIVLLSSTLILGILTAGRAAPVAAPAFVRAALHRTISLVMVVAVAIHVLTSIVETYVNIGWLSLVVPFSSSYNRLWVGLGTVAFDLVGIVIITSLLRDKIPVRAWKLVHLSAYALWPIALLHGIGTSTTDGVTIMVISIVCALAVSGALIWRVGRGSTDATRRETAHTLSWR
jgi:methionine sulfoxide reductase heme-binding subunit